MKTSKNKQKVSYNECMLLGLIAEGINYGYELDKTLDERGMRYWTKLSKKGIYLILQRLEEKELIKANSDDNTPLQINYTITEEGSQQLKEMVATGLASHRLTKFDYSIPIALLYTLPRNIALRQIEKRQRWLQNFIQQIPSQSIETDTQVPLGKRANIRFLRQHYTMEMTWLEWVQTELKREANCENNATEDHL